MASKTPDRLDCYKRISEKEVEKIKKEIDLKLKAMFIQKDLTKEEYDAMLTKDKNPGKFYELFKVHKERTGLPPGRPVITVTQIIKKCTSFY